MADLVSLTIDVDTRQVVRATGDLGKLGTQAQKTSSRVDHFGKSTRRSAQETDRFSNVVNKLRGAVGLLSAGIAGVGIAGLARQVERATTQMNNINATMTVAAGNAAAAGNQIAFIREESERLGLFFPSVAKQMAQFAAAARSANMTGEELRQIFTGISEASRAMGLTAPQAEGAMMALQQMMSKGKVSAEELRQQLGERMPGSIQIMASALDVTTSKLFDMMENGELLSDEVLPKFGAELQRVFGAEAATQADRIAASIQRLRTAFFELMSQGDLRGASASIDALAEAISSDEFQESFDGLVKSISDFGLVLAKNVETLEIFTKVLLGVGLTRMAQRLIVAAEGLVVYRQKALLAKGVTVSLTGSLSNLRKVLAFLARSPAGIFFTAATAVASLSQIFRKTTETSDDFRESISGVNESLDQMAEKAEVIRAEKELEAARKEYQAYLEIVEEIQDRGVRLAEALSGERFFVNFQSQRNRIEDLKEDLAGLTDESEAYFSALERLEVAQRRLFAARFIETSGQEMFKNRRQAALAAAKAQNAERIAAMEVIAQYDEGLAKSLEYAESVRELTKAFLALGRTEEEAARLARELASEMEEANRQVSDFVSNIPQIDLLPPKMRNLQRVVEGVGSETEETALSQKQLLDLVEDTGTRAPKAFGQMEDALRDVGSVIKDDISNGLTDIIMQAESAKDVFEGLLDTIARTLIQRQVVDPFVNSLYTPSGGGLGDGGGRAANQGGMGGGDIFSTIAGFIPGFANGGNVRGGQAHIVGERGPEMFVPRQDGQIVPNHQMGGGNISINVINEGGDPVSVKEQSVRKSANGDLTVDMMIKKSIDRLDSRGELDGMFRRHGGTRQGRM